MSTLLEYLNEAEKVVEKWPDWKRKSIREAFQIPPLNCEKEPKKKTTPPVELVVPEL